MTVVDFKNLDKALEKVMKANKKWNFRNRTYIYETCSDMIRYWRLIATAADNVLVTKNSGITQ